MRLLEDSLAEEFLAGRLKEGEAAVVDVNDDKQVVISPGTPIVEPQLVGSGI